MKPALFLLLMSLTFISSAQTVTWDGGGGNIDWENPLNWDGNILPCGACDVIINNSNVKISSSQTVKGVTFTGGNKQFTITNTAHLIITNSYGYNSISLRLNEEAQLTIEGSLEIIDCTNGLISEKAIIVLPLATSELLISNITNIGIDSRNEFLNENGFINISNCGDQAIFNQGNFKNQSLIKIQGLALGASNIDNQALASFNNEGQIIADHIGSPINRGVFTNSGSISLINAEEGIDTRDLGIFYNHGLIEILKILGCGSTGISMLSNFINYADGIITINNAEVGVFVRDTLINEGIINITNSSFAGFEIDEAAYIDNSSQIKISNSYFGIKVQGLGVGKIQNGVNGLVEVNNSSEIGIYSANNILNNGKIKVGNAGINGIECHDGSSIEMGTCGEIINSSSLVLFPNALITNYGFFQNLGNVVIDPTANIDNIGVFVDNSFSISNLVNFNNTGLLFKPLKGEISVGIKEMNLVSQTSSNTYFVSTNWWTNKAHTTVAGQYVFSENGFSPNANAPYADSLYLDVTNFICTRFITLPIYKVPVCLSTETYTFTQATSTNWHDPANWDTGKVPDYCTIAIIPNTKKCTITTGRKARAFRILSDTGSVFDAELGVVLEVKN